MKKSELQNIRGKDKKELEKLLEKKRLEAIQTKVKMKVSKEKNLKNVKMLRRDISQIATILREKELFEESKEEKE